MSTTNPTLEDRLRWICNTSTDEGKDEIKRLLTNPDIANDELRDLFEKAMAYEVHNAHRKSLIVALRSALRKFTPKTTVDAQIAGYERYAEKQFGIAEEADVEVLAPLPAATDTAALVATINAHHERAQNDAAHAKAYGESAVQAAILAGLQLVELKSATPHGNWEQMFTSGLKRVGKANATHVSHLEFDSQTARRYVAVATQLVTQKLQPEQSAVLMELARGGPMTKEAAELLNEITPPKSLRKTYLELGIVKPTPKEAAWLSDESGDVSGKPQEPAGKAAVNLRSAKDSARIEWFGLVTPGCTSPGSPVGLMEIEIHDSARGTMRKLSNPISCR